MFTQSFRRAIAISLASMLSMAAFAGGQTQDSLLKITRPADVEKQYSRNRPAAELTRENVFNRINPEPQPLQRRSRRFGDNGIRANSFIGFSAAVPQVLSIGTGGGDIDEIEPNDQIAQGVSLPVNVFGEVLINGDVDSFAFQALAGSQLIASVALYDSSGVLADTAIGDENTDPVLRYTPTRDQVLVAAITDADSLGGRAFDYVLNITRGRDVNEQEPNDRTAQNVSELPATIFGDIASRDDVDFYSFTAVAGQTLIVDV